MVFCFLLHPVLAISRTCTREIDPQRISQDTLLCADNYYPHNYPNGINITADNIVLDCGTSVLHGAFKNAGIVLINRKNITIKNCQIANYEIGILIKNSKQITIINANLIRNNVGMKIIDSSSIIVENSFDISIKKPLQLINSKGNSFHFINKKMEGDYCRLNQCNTPTGLAAKEIESVKANTPKKTLARNLKDAIRSWIYPSKQVFS